MKKRMAALTVVFCMMAGLIGCGAQQEKPLRRQVFAMDTVMMLTAQGPQAEEALRQAEEELHRLEALFSRTRVDSTVSRLNREAGTNLPVEVGGEVTALLETAWNIGENTGGAFDITLAPVSSAWGFTEECHRVPGQEELAGLLEAVGMEHVHTEGDRAWLDAGTQVDLGAIAKGYASDRVAEIYRENGVTSGTISLGGDAWVYGEKDGGRPWVIGIQDPERADQSDAYVGRLSLSDHFAITSGRYQRFFEEDGQVYHHILDPKTGAPARSGLTSVTVVTEGSGTLGDALSTALFVMGEEQALDFWRSGVYDFEAVLVTEDGRVVVTAGLEEAFAPGGGGYTYEIVS